MTVFPAPVADVFSGDATVNKKLQDALNTAITSVAAHWAGSSVFSNYWQGTSSMSLRTPILIAALDPANPHDLPVAGVRHTEMFFSGSVLKLAAMFGAFAIVKSAQDVLAATTKPFPETIPAVTALLVNELNPTILASVPRLLHDKGLSMIDRLPNWPAILTITAAQDTQPTAVMSPTISGAIDPMIALSDDQSASECIDALGYSWINGLMQSQGLFRADKTNNGDGSGIWLAGDYESKRPVSRIHCVNDHPDAQVTTCLDVARLISWIALGSIPDSSAMFTLFKKAETNRLHFLSRIHGLPFTTVASKVGIGGVLLHGSQTTVYSEALIIKVDDHGTDRLFAVVWQNLPYRVASVASLIKLLPAGLTPPFYPADIVLAPMAMIVKETVEGFLAAPMGAAAGSGAPPAAVTH